MCVEIKTLCKTKSSHTVAIWTSFLILFTQTFECHILLHFIEMILLLKNESNKSFENAIKKAALGLAWIVRYNANQKQKRDVEMRLFDWVNNSECSEKFVY